MSDNNIYRLKRLDRYLFEIKFDRLPANIDNTDGTFAFGCSSYVKDGKLHRNLDWNYDNLASFKVVCPEFTGMSFVSGLTDMDQPEESLLKLPFRVVDGVNRNGIMCSAHVLYNDWDFSGHGEIPLTSLPHLVLTKVKSMSTIMENIGDVLNEIYVPQSMALLGYLLQVLVTDGVTTYCLTPKEDGSGYEAVNITENPKLSNFKWVSDRTATISQLQERPNGVERWNMMPCTLEELRFTKAYEEPERLSEFIGERGTNKDSPVEELLGIYNDAHDVFLNRERDGRTWHTMHSTVYAPDGMKHLWIQENWKKDFCVSDDIRKNIVNGLLASGSFRKAICSNIPSQYGDRNRQYFKNETSSFISKFARYASDFFTAKAQGLFAGKPFEWTEVRIRMSDVVRPTAAIQREFDDYKMILVESPRIEYIPQGAKFEAMGSTWLMINPVNISRSSGTGIVRRCRATWNHLDYYGNILREPIVVESDRANASETDNQQWERETKGYYNFTMQKNPETSQLNTNSRIMLGSGIYSLTGFTDFLQEFTGDNDSVRLIRASGRYEEPNANIDDIENRVADGKNFRWEIDITNQKSQMLIGESVRFYAVSRRNGEETEGTDEHPISYIWESSDPEIISVDDSGLVTALSEGTATITVMLSQNPAKSFSMPVTASGSIADPHIEFTTAIPDRLNAYDTAIIGAAYFENGTMTDEEVEFEFSGAEKSAYSVEAFDPLYPSESLYPSEKLYPSSGNAFILKVWSGSVTPLTITAKREEYRAQVQIPIYGI